MGIVAFYFSEKAKHTERHRTNITRTIDGIEFTEMNSFEDGEEIKPYNSWDDNVLVAVVENVDTNVFAGSKSVVYDTGTLGGRVSINGVIQGYKGSPEQQAEWRKQGLI
jgi:hypothetical protein